MYAQKESKSKVIVSLVKQKKGNVNQSSGIVDNRPAAVARRDMLELVNNSRPAKQNTQLKATADNQIIQLAGAEVDQAIYETIGGKYKADEGIAFLYVNGKNISSATVPYPKPDTEDPFAGPTLKDNYKTVKDGENYLLQKISEDLAGEIEEIKKEVDDKAEVKEVEKPGAWGKMVKTKVITRFSVDINVEVDVVGSAGACDHCKNRLMGFKILTNKILDELKEKKYITDESSLQVVNHYTTWEKQTGPGPGGYYGWDNAVEVAGTPGKDSYSDVTEYRWWEKAV